MIVQRAGLRSGNSNWYVLYTQVPAFTCCSLLCMTYPASSMGAMTELVYVTNIPMVSTWLDGGPPYIR